METTSAKPKDTINTILLPDDEDAVIIESGSGQTNSYSSSMDGGTDGDDDDDDGIVTGKPTLLIVPYLMLTSCPLNNYCKSRPTSGPWWNNMKLERWYVKT